MKISVVTGEYPPCIFGGRGIHVEAMCRELVKLAELEVIFIGEASDLIEASYDQKRDRLPLEQIPGIPVYNFTPPQDPSGSEKQLSILRELSGSVNCIEALKSADIISSHGLGHNLSGTVAQAIFRAKHVPTLHGIDRELMWETERRGGEHIAKLLFEELAIMKAAAIISVSQSLKSNILKWYSVDPNKIAVIPNGIDHERYWPDKSTDLLPEVDFDWSSPFLLFVGRSTPQKGLLHLLKAMQLLSITIPLVIRAGTPETPKLNAQIMSEVADLRSQGREIIWLESGLGPGPMRQLYSHAAILCSPSIYEPFGMVNLEALACGTPVVASAVGGIKEFVIHEINGLLIDNPPDGMAIDDDKESAFRNNLAKSLMKLITNSEMTNNMGEAGRLHSMQFSWTAIARKTIQLYQT
ncbi:MAG: glycosyltransferase family 4 protein, partial [Candidatus Dormibacteraceae bacterium]